MIVTAIQMWSQIQLRYHERGASALSQSKKQLQNKKRIVIITLTGVWRSLVARTAGGREVAGSNPVAPTESWKNQGFPDF